MSTSLEDTIRGKGNNLLDQVPIEKAERPSGFYKSITLDVLAVCSALYFGYSLKVFLESGSALNIGIAAFLFLIISSLETILSKSLSRRFLVLLLEVVAIMLFFYQEQKAYVGAAAGAFILLSIWGEIAARSEILSGLEIRFLKFTAPVFKKTITALIFMAIVLYVPRWNEQNVFVPQKMFSDFFASSAGFANNFYPEINFNSTVDELARDMAGYQLAGTSPYKDLPAATKKTILEQAGALMSSELKKFLGGGVTGNQSMGEVLYKVILDYLNKWRMQFGNWFMVAWVAAVFLTARSAGVFVWWAAALISLFIFHILVSLNFIAIRGETTTKETTVFT